MSGGTERMPMQSACMHPCKQQMTRKDFLDLLYSMGNIPMILTQVRLKNKSKD